MTGGSLPLRRQQVSLDLMGWTPPQRHRCAHHVSQSFADLRVDPVRGPRDHQGRAGDADPVPEPQEPDPDLADGPDGRIKQGGSAIARILPLVHLVY